MDAHGFRESATSAIRYWEPRRIIFNLVLAAIVLIYFALGYPTSMKALSIDEVLVLFMLAVLANVAYCGAYIVDIFAQQSGYLALWEKNRWILFLIGTVFAGAITRFFALGMFSSASR